ncbi:YHS domain-containing (seleno)protein [Spirosoma spitsbergense]|uniref:YHS domain-containing (seleno)protein n=1 Tax=Spirosoma spitsbergense TaxID=431554 RepID=UPI0005AB044E|nr:YHS domain-containing (seleno)protein [Spirosoma spitsbergense]
MFTTVTSHIHRNAPLIVAGILLLLTFSTAEAQTERNRTQGYNLSKGVAIQGYDPVAYFVSHKAVKGAGQFATTYNGVTYQFASAANRDQFLKKPAAYEPAYGGWCAYAMGDSGEKVAIDPETFEVRDGHLYLFYHTLFTNTLPKWQKDQPTLLRKADQNWAALLAK